MTGGAGARSVRGVTWRISNSARKQIERLANQFVDIERLRLHVAALVQRAEAADDLGGAVVVGHDIVADLAQLGEIDVLASEHFLRCLGVAENRGERLIQLVRDRRPTAGPASTRGSCAEAHARSCDARSSASLRSVMSTRDAEQLPILARFRSSARRDPAHAAVGYRRRGTRRRTRSPVASAVSHGAFQILAIRRDARPRDLLERYRLRCRVAACRHECVVARTSSAGHVPDHIESCAARAARLICFWASSSADAVRRRERRSRSRAAINPACNIRMRDTRGDLAPILVPRGRLAEPDDGIGRQQALVDAPAAQLAPIDHRHVRDRGRSDVRRWGAVQQPDGDGGGLLRLRLRTAPRSRRRCRLRRKCPADHRPGPRTPRRSAPPIDAEWSRCPRRRRSIPV